MKEVINEYNVVPLPVTMNEQPGRFLSEQRCSCRCDASQEVKKYRFQSINYRIGCSRYQIETGGELHENVPTIVF